MSFTKFSRLNDTARRIMHDKLSDDEFYDLTRSFLSETREVPTVYVVDKDDKDVFIDPNTGDIITDDIKEYDDDKLKKVFRVFGITQVVVRDKVGKASPGVYSPQSFLRRLKAKLYPIVKGQKI